MATFFGEISPLNSRAVYDDDDDCLNRSGTINIRMLSSDTGSNEGVTVHGSGIVFAVGEVAEAFVKCSLLSSEYQMIACAEIVPSTDAEESVDINSSQKCREVGVLYSTLKTSDVLVCCIRANISDEFCFDLCQQILSICIEVSHCAILVSYHSSTYKSICGIADGPFLRCLATTEYLKSVSNLDTPYLESPNIVSGFPAAVMSDFEIRKKKAILYVCYTDVLFVDSVSVKLFNVLLRNPLIQCVLRQPIDFDARFKSYFKENRNEQTNLYT